MQELLEDANFPMEIVQKEAEEVQYQNDYVGEIKRKKRPKSST